ncbi:MAG TPA: class I SAM-dependent methyltransferase [Halanaerobiales bacterium]|nr:class I SAM-dependent methyltransferase [Halanaerobiales bacterium]
MKDLSLIQGVEYSHQILKKYIEKKDVVIDATVGNGNDTLFLAKLVGKNGKIYGFDIQRKAIRNTRNKLVENNYSKRVKLIEDGHENMKDHIENEDISAILFNLGYLPGSDKKIITRPNTTLKAIKNGLEILIDGGIIVIVIYPGHEGGKIEKEKIIEYASDLDRKKYNVLHYYYLNQENKPPEVLVIRKRLNI